MGGAVAKNEADPVLAPELKTLEGDTKQRSLLRNDKAAVYFDPSYRDAPVDQDAYCASHHITMSPGVTLKTETDHVVDALGRKRHIADSLPSFASVASVLRGTNMIALMPERFRKTTSRDLGFLNLPSRYQAIRSPAFGTCGPTPQSVTNG